MGFCHEREFLVAVGVGEREREGAIMGEREKKKNFRDISGNVGMLVMVA